VYSGLGPSMHDAAWNDSPLACMSLQDAHAAILADATALAICVFFNRHQNEALYGQVRCSCSVQGT